MAEAFLGTVLRNIAKKPWLHRLVAQVVSRTRAPVRLPQYVPKEHMPRHSTVLRPSPSVDGPVFITARFRSGSTMLWQLFNNFDAFTAYYEPLNERQWFNPEKRGDHMDHTHRIEQVYWENYDDLQDAGKYFRTHWTYHRIAMGEKAHDDNMQRYLSSLIDKSRTRPVLQFNRADFRLQYLRAKFPGATILHLRRNERDTWVSTLRGIENNPDWTINSFIEYCRFYLLPWYRDLTVSFPDLIRDPRETHPYEIHYLLARLSDLFAIADAHISTTYEALSHNFDEEVPRLFKLVSGKDIDPARLYYLLAPNQRLYDHRKHAAFYEKIEDKVEAFLRSFLPGLDAKE